MNTLAAEYRPHSSSAQFTDLWQQDTATPELMEVVFDRWRARSLNPKAKLGESEPRAPSIQDTRAALKTRAQTRRPVSPQPAPRQPAPKPVAQQQPNALASQVRERLKAKAAAGQAKPQSLADVKSMLNSAFHKNI